MAKKLKQSAVIGARRISIRDMKGKFDVSEIGKTIVSMDEIVFLRFDPSPKTSSMFGLGEPLIGFYIEHAQNIARVVQEVDQFISKQPRTLNVSRQHILCIANERIVSQIIAEFHANSKIARNLIPIPFSDAPPSTGIDIYKKLYSSIGLNRVFDFTKPIEDRNLLFGRQGILNQITNSFELLLVR